MKDICYLQYEDGLHAVEGEAFDIQGKRVFYHFWEGFKHTLSCRDKGLKIVDDSSGNRVSKEEFIEWAVKQRPFIILKQQDDNLQPTDILRKLTFDEIQILENFFIKKHKL